MKQQTKFLDFRFPDRVFGLDKYFLVLFFPPLGLLMVFLISLNLIFIPKINEITNIRSQIRNVNLETDKINQQNKYLISIDQEQLQKNTEYLNNAVLKNKQSYLLVGVIRNISNRFDFQLKSFSLVPGELKGDEAKTSVSKLENMTKMPISLVVSGPKSKYLDLVLALEKTLPILFIDKFETRASGDLLSMSMTVYSYYINDGISVNTDKISLNDLILSNEESALIEKISAFTKIEDSQQGVGTTELKQYSRENPFSI